MLLDHFHPPVSYPRDWEGFHSLWACSLADHLNRQLVPPWHAEPNLRFDLELDVAGVYRELPEPLGGHERLKEYHPRQPQVTVPMRSELKDLLEVEVIRSEGGREVVAAIEFVSPANKDQPERRQAFVSKCEYLLAQGIGLVIVDVVTERHANLHALLMDRLSDPTQGSEGSLYAASDHPVEKKAEHLLDIRFEPLMRGNRLPELPLFLKDGPCVKVALNQTYRKLCRQSRLLRDLENLQALETTAQQPE